MTRRNQSHRRHTYGRRQHEVRERRDESRPAEAWFSETESELDADWQVTDSDERSSHGESIGGFSR
jgi:hypothetical protein